MVDQLFNGSKIACSTSAFLTFVVHIQNRYTFVRLDLNFDPARYIPFLFNSQWDPWQTLSWRKKPWVTAEILDLCDKMRQLRKNRFEPEGSEKYREMNNIKKWMEKRRKKKLDRRTLWWDWKKVRGRATAGGHTNSWKTWPLYNRGNLLLSKTVQENAFQKTERYWTDWQNTALSCVITRLMEIQQCWTVPRQTQKMSIPSFAKKWRLQYNHWTKGSQLESTTSQQNWSKQVERM